MSMLEGSKVYLTFFFFFACIFDGYKIYHSMKNSFFECNFEISLAHKKIPLDDCCILHKNVQKVLGKYQHKTYHTFMISEETPTKTEP